MDIQQPAGPGTATPGTEHAPTGGTFARIGRALARLGNGQDHDGASCTQSPTLRAGLGGSAPGVAEEARREGAPDREAGAASALDPDQLNALQLDILAAVRTDQSAAVEPAAADSEYTRAATAAFLHENTAARDVPKLNTPTGAQTMPTGKIRKFNGKRRTSRVGPVDFTPAQYAELLAAADRHGYGDTVSGYVGDISLAFIRGDFTVDLPLHTDRLAVQEFRAKVLFGINRIGVNINQLTRVFHGDGRIEPDIRERLERLEHLLTRIAEALLIPTDDLEGGTRP